ncbi:hypothetical protein RY831_21045 [Noviherbaspirillum sp. CPCC 100848]|uniref:Uncharacterized protein n=1 Tax=Noviherbaspirillum album TaxID=3080276 RepID=A0ABU6JDD7_9BURK|nr:hypothetical protein [Noviherbaspirillum sp. CPCC 100848]MEC4721659.1 hypothetical protein [Noviherbaspirillum sp. CPCC 100848]
MPSDRHETETRNKPENTDDIGARLGIAAVMALAASSLARAFGGPAWLYLPMLGAMLLLIAAGFGRINNKLRTTSLILFSVGLLAVPFAKDAVAAVQRGVFVSGMLVSLTASVLLIARCAVQSPRIQMIGAALRERQGTPRYAAFTLASQFFSGILGLAGANLMFVMAAPPTEKQSETRTATVVSVSRGFTAASCWSPVFGNMAILLALYPSLHWAEVFPVGLALGQLTVAVSVFMQHAAARRAAAADAVADDSAAGVATTSAAAPPTPLSTLLWIAAPVVLVLLGFLLVIMSLSRMLHIMISAAIIMMGPLVSLAFNAGMGEPGRRLASGVRGLLGSMRLFPALGSEAMLFLSAGCAGSIMADAFPEAWVSFIGAHLGGHPFLAVGFLVLGIMAAALAGIHPVLSAVFLASTLTPAVLAIPPIAHMAAILAGWGLSASVTPFSVLSLTASRYAGVSLYRISLGINWKYAVANAVIVCGLLTAYILVLA